MSQEKITRKSLPEHDSNPSIPIASQNAKIGTRRIPNKTGTQCMIVSEQGEVVAPAGFHEIIEVDKTQFVKMFVGGVKAFNDLSAPGTKVFEMLYRVMLKNPNVDKVYLHHKSSRIAKATFDRGLTELLVKEILYRAILPGWYYININYLFNGDRYALIKEYRLKSEYEEQQESLPL